MSTRTNPPLGKGYPTAINGDEANVGRKFEPLLELTSLKDKTVLDLGCGFGGGGKFASKRGAEVVVGCDFSKDYLIKAKKIYCVQGNIYDLPFKEKSFDIVLLTEVLEHVPYQVKALQEIKRLLKEHSFLLITVPNKFYPFETHGCHGFRVEHIGVTGVGFPLLSWAPQFIRNHVEEAKIYTGKSLTQLMNEVGFQVHIIDYMMPTLEGFFLCDSVKESIFRNPLVKILGMFEYLPFFKYFGISIIAICTPNTSISCSPTNQC
jgi:SAM-dependent methyltransferase